MAYLVLVVDDSSATRSFMTVALEDAGFEVTCVESAHAALKALPARRYDLVIADLNMPEINGLELLRFVRQSPTHHDLPVLIVSTERHERDRERGFALGADGFLAKPFSADLLCQTAHRLVGLLPTARGSGRLRVGPARDPEE